MSEERKFNQPFVPLAPLPTKEQAEAHETQRSESHLKDTMVLQPETLKRFAAADWLTKIEVASVMGHIHTLESRNKAQAQSIEALKAEINSLDQEANTWALKVEAYKKVPSVIVDLFQFLRGSR